MTTNAFIGRKIFLLKNGMIGIWSQVWIKFIIICYLNILSTCVDPVWETIVRSFAFTVKDAVEKARTTVLI